MAEFGKLEKNAVRREGCSEIIDYTSSYREYDSLDRLVYQAIGFEKSDEIEEYYYEYYKDTNWITKFSVSYKDDKYRKGGRIILFTNEAEYFDDGSLKYLKLVGDLSKTGIGSADWEIKESWEIPTVYYEKKYNDNGKLVYYKDSTGYECEWIYDKYGGYVCNMISVGKKGDSL